MRPVINSLETKGQNIKNTRKWQTPKKTHIFKKENGFGSTEN